MFLKVFCILCQNTVTFKITWKVLNERYFTVLKSYWDKLWEYVIKNRKFHLKKFKVTLPWLSQRHPRSNQWYHITFPSKSQNFCMKHFFITFNIFCDINRSAQLKWDTLYNSIYRLCVVPCQQCCPLHTDSFVGRIFVAFSMGVDTPYL